MKKFNSILEEYGVLGCESISKPILTALVTEKPILFFTDKSKHKVICAGKISTALGINNTEQKKEFIVYDAANLQLEDIAGFQNPVDQKNEKCDYTESPLTIWNKKFIVIDEISRACSSLKIKLPELIGSRKFMGMKVPNIQHIFATMSLIENAKLNTISSELAEMFSLIVNVPKNLKRMDLSEIFNFNQSFKKLKSDELTELISEIKKLSNNLEKNNNLLIENFVSNFKRKAQKLGIPFSQKNAEMMKENLSVFFAIDVFGGSLTEKEIVKNLFLAAIYSWKYYVTEKQPHFDRFKKIFKHAIKNIVKNYDEILKELDEYKQYKHLSKTKSKNAAKNKKRFQYSPNNSYKEKDEPESDFTTMLKILGAGIELFTVGFYEIVIKNNSDWESKLDINN